jgi:hypothetical protein
MCLVDQPLHLLVDRLRHLVTVVAMFAEGTVEKHHLLALAVANGAKALAHAPLGDHSTRQSCYAFQVVGGTGGDVAEADLLRNAAAEKRNQLVAESGARHQVRFFIGKLMV